MPSSRVVRVRSVDDGVAAGTLRAGVERIHGELDVSPDFPPEVEATAATAAGSPRLPDLDRTDVPFVTIDPPGSRDLDQALHLSRNGSGYVVEYAIADVAAFVTPGDPVDLEAHRRGETLYGADSKVPLHPAVLSEGAASLLPGEVRPALLWTIRLDDEGTRTDVHVERARVRSTAQLTYAQAQAAIDGGTADESLALLREIGELRIAREAARGGVSLPLPEQDIEVAGERWHLEFRQQLPVELWNAQLSLLTGFAAADLMLYARIGLLRTLPPPDPRDVQRLHRTARALGIEWPAEQLYPDFIRTLDPAIPAHAAMVNAATRLLRGSGYVAFDGETPAQPLHSALAEQYAHVTAPLRRLGDRYASEVCLALCAGTDVPDWVRAALPSLPKTLQASGSRSRTYERAVLDLVEAGVLASRVGEVFGGVVVDVDDKDERRGVVVLHDPDVEAVVGSEETPLPLGTDVRVRLTTADVATRRVEFQLVEERLTATA
ncbi:RNB domain-containing ribonuclease [Nocardioides sp. LMS-CY]|uniref:RNB domain-containing ribonuclease n=1 Tax=Nocardioides sp. (strain LMS-CY) TaxID=2840457 RepID=UPI001C0068D1|nr:RNB domain-containing ribonuclease [Nocardioides sp. LMS-CY]QWF20611.1 RNB domain-containing ribonuclease [Nocardioides sp. LMS-CY]